MHRRPSRRLFSALSFALEAIGLVVSSAYKAIFAWWLDGLLIRLWDRHFAREIRDGLVLLFSDHGAVVVPNGKREWPYPSIDRWPMVTVVTVEIHFLFSRERDDLSVEIALPVLPHKWESLGQALDWLDLQQDVRPDVSSWGGDLRAADRFLAAHWEDMKAALRVGWRVTRPRSR